MKFFFPDAFIISRSENELTDIYSLLMDNLYHVSSALGAMEASMKSGTTAPTNTPIKDTVDIITTL